MNETEQYTQEEINNMAEAIWGNGLYHPHLESLSLACRRCGANVEVRFSQEVGSHNMPPRFRATCSECGASGRGQATNKERRRLSDEEIDSILQLARRGRTSPCPVCQAPLHVKEIPIAGRAAGPWIITCHRCGTRGQGG